MRRFFALGEREIDCFERLIMTSGGRQSDGQPAHEEWNPDPGRQGAELADAALIGRDNLIGG